MVIWRMVHYALPTLHQVWWHESHGRIQKCKNRWRSHQKGYTSRKKVLKEEILSTNPPKNWRNWCSIPVGTPAGPSKTQGMPKRDCKSQTEMAEMQASTINPPKHWKSRGCFPGGNSCKPNQIPKMQEQMAQPPKGVGSNLQNSWNGSIYNESIKTPRD